jgi:hypothetical protein
MTPRVLMAAPDEVTWTRFTPFARGVLPVTGRVNVTEVADPEGSDEGDAERGPTVGVAAA